MQSNMAKNLKIATQSKNNTLVSPKDGFLPFLLTAVCMLITFLATLIDKFIYPFGADMLSPALGQIIILLIPIYLCLQLLAPEKTMKQHIKALGIGKLHAEYAFFIIFSSLFVISGGALLTIICGGARSAAEGFTILAAFTAGTDEYATNYPYLLVVYVLIPAILEELLLRGVIFTRLKTVDTRVAVLISSLISALFAFSLGGIPAAIFCALTYCFVLITTRALQASMIVHLAYNLYALLLGSNMSAYFLSSQNNTLLILIVIGALLISASLFFTEAAKIYRAKAARVADKIESPTFAPFNVHAFRADVKALFSFHPTAICAIATIVLYAVIMIVCSI